MLIHDINIDEKYSNSDFDFGEEEQLLGENIEVQIGDEKKGSTKKEDQKKKVVTPEQNIEELQELQDQIPIQEEYTHGFDNTFELNFLDEFDYTEKCEPAEQQMEPEQDELIR